VLPDPVEYNHAARFLAQYSITKDASDQPLIRQVNDEMRDGTLAKIVWVTDRGFSSEQNRPLPASAHDGKGAFWATALKSAGINKGRGPVGFRPIGQACDLPVWAR
jgi:hypothetical protein